MPGEAVIASVAIAGGAVPGTNANANWRTKRDEAHQRQVQARPPHGRERLRTAQEPGQPPRIWSRSARPAPQGQDVGLRHPAARQAEAEGLLWRRDREAVQARL